MEQRQKWYACMKNGEEIEFTTRMGLSFGQAIANNGLFLRDVQVIRPQGIIVVDDIKAWRTAPGFVAGSAA